MSAGGAESMLPAAWLWAGWLAAGVVLFILPGWALLAFLWPDWRELDAGEKLGLSGGLSLAAYPVVFLWADTAGLRLGAWAAWAAILSVAGCLALRLWRRLTTRERPRISFRLSQTIFWTILALIVWTRIAALQGVQIPLWGDSYQHTLIARLIVDHGGLFTDWQPYAELTSLTYHFGFHVAAAAFHWLTGLEMPQAVLVSGQIINILAVLSLYPLATRLVRSPWSGAAALLIAGLLLWNPMRYTQWGRYPQLAGQAILPAAVVLVWRVLDRPLPRRSAWLPAWLALAGLALTHYRVAIFGLFFGIVYLAFEAFRRPAAEVVGPASGEVDRDAGRHSLWRRQRWRLLEWRLPAAFGRAAILAAGSLLLLLPWLPRLAGGGIWRQFSRQITTLPAQLSDHQKAYNAFGDLPAYLPGWVWVGLAAAVVWFVWQRRLQVRTERCAKAEPTNISTDTHSIGTSGAAGAEVHLWNGQTDLRAVALAAAWWGLLLLATNPNWLGLPGSGVISNFAYWIAAYIPAALFIGSATGGWIENVRAWIEKSSTARSSSTSRRIDGRLGWGAAGLAGVFLAAGVWGAGTRLQDLDLPAYSLVTQADLQAMAWIRANTPPEARFLVNSFPAYGGAVVAGSDAGWWLPLLAGRRTSQPPLNYGSETGPRPDYTRWINALPETIARLGVTHPQTLAVLKDRSLGYVYIGPVQNPSQARLPVEEMLADPHFRPVYHQAGVWIFLIDWEP